MKPAPFDYLAASSAQEALTELAAPDVAAKTDRRSAVSGANAQSSACATSQDCRRVHAARAA